MNIYTIGFTQKSAEEFFELLQQNNIKSILDIRLNNSSQLAGFTKGRDLKFFLKRILDIEYFHDTLLSPTKQILDDYKKSRITWSDYEEQFLRLLSERNIRESLRDKYNNRFDNICLLCSEATAEKCHRRLVAEYLVNMYPEYDIKIIHI